MREVLASGTPVEVIRPRGEPPLGLVIAPDIMGLRPLFDDHVAHLAEEHGWAVCAVEPFPGLEHLTLEERLDASLDVPRTIDDLVSAAGVLACDTLAVLGFCMGGMHAFLAAGTGQFDRAVSFYGMVSPPLHWRHPKADSPLTALARDDACPVLAIVAGRDTWVSADDVKRLEAVGSHITVVTYPEAEHGFVHDPTRPTHRPEDAADAWRRAIDFLSS